MNFIPFSVSFVLENKQFSITSTIQENPCVITTMQLLVSRIPQNLMIW